MKKFCKLAKRIDIVARILFWLCAVVGIIVAIVIVFTPVFPDDFFTEMVVTINLGQLEMELAQEYNPSIDDLKLFFYSMSFLSLVASVFACCMIESIRKILKPMKEERPFENEVSMSVKKLSWIVLIGGMVMEIGYFITQTIEYQVFDFPNLFLSDKIVKCNQEYFFDGNFLVGFLILYLLSYVFRYGEELQIQSDETL